LNLTFSIL